MKTDTLFRMFQKGKDETARKTKHDANLRKRPLLHFQIGLILSLMATYFVLEAKTSVKEHVIETVKVEEEPDVFVMDNYKIYEPKKVVEKVVKKKTPLVDEFKLKENDDPTEDVKEELFTGPETTNDSDFDPDAVDNAPVEVDDNVPFFKIEVAPIYPGCESLGTNEERKACMSEKIGKLIRKKFKTSLADRVGLSGRQTIRTQFTIDKTGNVTDVKVRGPHPLLEKEAKRVIGLVPTMIPGKQRDHYVNVIYTIPIIFNVQ